MAGSEAEEVIRRDVEAWCMATLPAARLIHELPVGGCRADLAAVEPNRLILFEIKSERDTLDRLDEQVRQFAQSSHGTIIVAAEKWFNRKPYDDGRPRMAWNKVYSRVDVWAHPAPDHFLYKWRDPRPHTMPPHPWHLLQILWREELMLEAETARLAFKSRDTKPHLMALMINNMTGLAIVKAVCRRLRERDVLRGTPSARVLQLPHNLAEGK